MDAHEVMKDVLKRTSAKRIAAELGLSLSLIYKWAEPPETASGSGTGSPLERVGELIRITGDARLAQWVCEQARGFYICNPQHLPPGRPLIPVTNDIVQEFADMLATIAISSSDSVITPDEAKKIRARWEELKSVTEGFVQAAESGNYGRRKRPGQPDLLERAVDLLPGVRAVRAEHLFRRQGGPLGQTVVQALPRPVGPVEAAAERADPQEFLQLPDAVMVHFPAAFEGMKTEDKQRENGEIAQADLPENPFVGIMVGKLDRIDPAAGEHGDDTQPQALGKPQKPSRPNEGNDVERKDADLNPRGPVEPDHQRQEAHGEGQGCSFPGRERHR